MAGNKQMERLQEIIKAAEGRLESSIVSLQATMKALLGGGLIPPKPKKDVLRALQQLRKALDKALRSLEKRIEGAPSRPARKRARKKSG
jgi:hypothetical protein